MSTSPACQRTDSPSDSVKILCGATDRRPESVLGEKSQLPLWTPKALICSQGTWVEMEHGMARGKTFDVYWSSDAGVEKPV